MSCYSNMIRVILSGMVILSFSMFANHVNGECWDTGCQPSTWLVQGCEEYGMKEVGRRACDGGTIFSCCHYDSVYDNNEVSPDLNEADQLGRTGDLTYYDLGLTACGQYYSNSDMVVALASSHFTTPNPNHDPICGRRLKIVDPASGRSVVVKVVDKCEGCKVNDVDVSPIAFQSLRPLSVGRFKVNWDFV